MLLFSFGVGKTKIYKLDFVFFDQLHYIYNSHFILLFRVCGKRETGRDAPKSCGLGSFLVQRQFLAQNMPRFLVR